MLIIRKRLTTQQRKDLFRRHHGICHICTNPILIHQRWEVSHPIALALGGDDVDANRAPAHFKCHAWQTRMTDLPLIAKSRRIMDRERDFPRSRRPLPGGRGDPLKRTISGRVVVRSTGQPWRPGL